MDDLDGVDDVDVDDVDDDPVGVEATLVSLVDALEAFAGEDFLGEVEGFSPDLLDR